MSTISARPPVFSGHLADHARGIRLMVQGQGQNGDVERRVFERQRFERAALDLDVGDAFQTPAGGVEHLGRAVHGHDAGHVRGHQFGDLTGAATQIADHGRGIGERQHRVEVHPRTEQLFAQTIPLP
jgi:hypothetical protein